MFIALIFPLLSQLVSEQRMSKRLLICAVHNPRDVYFAIIHVSTMHATDKVVRDHCIRMDSRGRDPQSVHVVQNLGGLFALRSRLFGLPLGWIQHRRRKRSRDLVTDSVFVNLYGETVHGTEGEAADNPRRGKAFWVYPSPLPSPRCIVAFRVRCIPPCFCSCRYPFPEEWNEL